jgi:hypothetical protein
MQAWAQAVSADTTILMLHSGNHEIIGVRHRARQTLYITDVTRPWDCPGYGQIQVGIYIAAIQDALQRAGLNKARERAGARSTMPCVVGALRTLWSGSLPECYLPHGD